MDVGLADVLRVAEIVEGAAARDHLVQHEAERVEVRARRDRAAQELLGGRVAERADEALPRRARRCLVLEARDAEVEQLRQRLAVVVVEEDVVGLHVAVDDAVLVRARERIEQIGRDVHRVREREGLLALEQHAEVLPVELLHHVEGQLERVRRAGGGDHVDDVRVLEPRERARLLLHAPREVRAVAELGVEGLEDVALADAHVLDVVDRAHAARTNEAVHPVDAAGDHLSGLVLVPRDLIHRSPVLASSRARKRRDDDATARGQR